MTGPSRDMAAMIGACLDTLCPMHAIVDRSGHILHAGPTLAKLGMGGPLRGARLLEVMELKRPGTDGSMAALMRLCGVKLHFVLRRPPRTELKGVLVPLDPGGEAATPGLAVLDFSFTISIVEAVRDFSLTGKDFAVTDLAVEMLYLIEAKSMVMEELRRLNLRLDGARLAAEQEAVTDTLTGLANRRAMDEALTRLVESGQGVAVMHLDLDGFKQVNDTHGHAAGDRVLQEVAQRLLAATRDGDTVVRTGGDEFLLILPGMTDVDEVARLAGRLLARVEEPVWFEGAALAVSSSIGTSLALSGEPLDATRMIDEADTALYAVKAAGRRGHRIYSADLGRMGGDGKATTAR